jgi:hypothetical protein
VVRGCPCALASASEYYTRCVTTVGVPFHRADNRRCQAVPDRAGYVRSRERLVAVGWELLVLVLVVVAQTVVLASCGGGDSSAYGKPARGTINPMAGVEQMGERPLEQLAQTASQQAVVLAREQVDVARRELTARARQAGPGVAMVGGGALLAALASGTGTAALILLLARRPGASAAALGVTGAYAGAGALLAREGLVRLRESGPPQPDVPVQDEPGQSAEQDLGSAKKSTKSTAKPPGRAKSAAKSTGRAKSAAKSAAQATGRSKPASKSPKPNSRRRASRTQTDGRPAS